MTSGVISSILNNSSDTNLTSSSIYGTNATSSVSKLSSIYSSDEDESSDDFASILQNAITNSLTDTQNLIDESEQAEIEYAIGQSDNTHDMQIAQNKANIAVSYVVAVRDRLISAYKEIMQMTV